MTKISTTIALNAAFAGNSVTGTVKRTDWRAITSQNSAQGRHLIRLIGYTADSAIEHRRQIHRRFDLEQCTREGRDRHGRW
jgi:hypothetical protein